MCIYLVNPCLVKQIQASGQQYASHQWLQLEKLELTGMIMCFIAEGGHYRDYGRQQEDTQVGNIF